MKKVKESIIDRLTKNGKPSVSECISLGKELINDWQWAHVCLDERLQDKYCQQRQELEWWILENLSENEICDYYNGINE